MSLNEDGPLDAETRRILAEDLRTLLADPSFVRSHVLSRLLVYLVEHRLESKGPAPKAYAIAIEALGRPADFDASADSYPRVMVGRLRTLMDKYYSGKPWLHRLRIPQGSYEVVVQYRTSPPGLNPMVKPRLEREEEAVLQPKTFVPLMPRAAHLSLPAGKLTPELFLSDLALAPVQEERPAPSSLRWKRRFWMGAVVIAASLLGGAAALLMDRYARSEGNYFANILSPTAEEGKPEGRADPSAPADESTPTAP